MSRMLNVSTSGVNPAQYFQTDWFDYSWFDSDEIWSGIVRKEIHTPNVYLISDKLLIAIIITLLHLEGFPPRDAVAPT